MSQVMLLLAQRFGVQRTNEELLEFLEASFPSRSTPATVWEDPLPMVPLLTQAAVAPTHPVTNFVVHQYVTE